MDRIRAIIDEDWAGLKNRIETISGSKRDRII
jgi:hypothetical protein